MDSEAEKVYTFRPYQESDIPFIQSSWGSSYYDGNSYKKLLTAAEFHQFHRPIREAFFLRGSTAVILCVSKEDQDLILGWIAVEKPRTSKCLVLHYIYVKHAFQGQGISHELMERALPEDIIIYTHVTEKARKIMRRPKIETKQYYFIPHVA